MTDRRGLLEAFHKTLVDRPLPPGDPYYVGYLEARGPHKDPVARLAQHVELADGATVQLLSGQRGTGKSTNLLRLEKKLSDLGCIVFYCDMDDYLNLTKPVEVTDFFMSLCGGLSEAVHARYGQDPGARNYWERLSRFLQTEVRITEARLGIEAAALKVELKDNADFKRRLQEHLRDHAAKLVHQAHAFTDEVVGMVREREDDPQKKVVMLLDSVEHIRGIGAEAPRVYESVENLFAAHAEQLAPSLLHVIYTIPPYLTPLAPGLGAQYDVMVQHLASLHVVHRDGTTDRDGLRAMREVVQRRCAEWEQVFSAAQVERMALATGGDLRDFMRMLRYVIGSALLAAADREGPVDDALVTDAEHKLRQEMLPIAEEDRGWLRRIGETKTPALEVIDELPRLARFLDTSLVLNYHNGDDWYDVHPLLRDELRRSG